MNIATRLEVLARSAASAMTAIDAHPPAEAMTVTYRLYVAPSGRRYVTVVGTLGGRAFAEVLAPVTDDPSWDATIAAVVAKEAQPSA